MSTEHCWTESEDDSCIHTDTCVSTTVVLREGIKVVECKQVEYQLSILVRLLYELGVVESVPNVATELSA